MPHWERTANGDLMPRAEALPVALRHEVMEGVPHLDGEGSLRLPAANGVLAGLRYGPDASWVGTLVVGDGAPPADPADGWGRLRVLLRLRLDPLRAWTGDAEGPNAQGALPVRALPAVAFDVVADPGSRAEAGFYEARLRLAFHARLSAELDSLAQAAVNLLVGWRLEDAVWSARGFALVGQEDQAAAESPEGSGQAVLLRRQTFAFRAWRQAAVNG